MSTSPQPATAPSGGSVVPTHPSNRSFISMLRAWGIEIEEGGGEKWKARLPVGNLVIMAPTYHGGNPASVFLEAYKALGLTAEQFWTGPPPAGNPPPPEAKAKIPRQRYINRVLDCLVQFGQPMSLQRIADELSLTTQQASSACTQLKQQEAVVMVKTGVYVAKQFAADTRVAIDITGPDQPIRLEGSHEHEVPQRPVALAPAPRPVNVGLDTDDDEPVEDEYEAPDIEVDELLEIVLDLMFPSGMNIKAGDLKYISDWIASTKVLLERVRSATR